jgi:PAS domain-containing protein
MSTPGTTQHYLHTVLTALKSESDWRTVLDEIPVPVYITDVEGAVTYWNRACIEFAGRVPQLGSDRWCVTWQLYTTTGEFLPHEDCPMAETLKTKKEVRGKVAIAMRPDGSRRAFRPYPTPIFDSHGELSGAVNLFVDVTHEQASELAQQAARCRRLARATTDAQASQILAEMAQCYAATAASLTGDSPVPPSISSMTVQSATIS